MTELLIRYQDSEGQVSERLISDIEVEDGKALVALCHLRGGKRTFRLDRIQSAIDPATGEVIADILVFLGLRPMASATPIPSRPQPKAVILSGEDLRRLRSREKSELWRPFGLPVVAEHFKRKLFALFDNRCFKCKSASPLEVDHHIPMVLGGHLVPGNLVPLCPRCNNRKGELSPMEFYSPSDLQLLAPLLDQERSLFHFQFDWEHWERDRRGHLLELGIDAALVAEVLNNEDHRYYIPPRPSREGTSVTITIDMSFIGQET